MTTDARGVFSTATALFALAGIPACPPVIRSVGPALRDDAYDDDLVRLAREQGVEPTLALQAFGCLTAESLQAPSPWPSVQLSTLAAGTPIEYSVGDTPAVRFTTEVGRPRESPGRRVVTGLAAVSRTAEMLGALESWRCAADVVDVLADPGIPVPDGSRFWLWAGVDLHAGRPAVLKSYVSLHTGDVEGWRAREDAALRAAGAGPASQAAAVVERLRRDGWCHEIGIGCAPGGRWALKVYYELDGWRADTVRDVLAIAGLPDDVESLTPEIPGVLRSTLAGRRRAGIAFRMQPGTGAVRDVTVAAAFPVPMLGRAVMSERVREWLLAQGSLVDAFDAAVGVLAPGWIGAPPRLRMLSLFTRTRSSSGSATTLYLRPAPRGGRPLLQ